MDMGVIEDGLASLGSSIASGVKDIGGFLGSDAGKGLTGLASLGLNWYGQNQQRDAYENVARQNFDMQKKYFNMAQQDRNFQQNQQAAAQEGLSEGFSLAAAEAARKKREQELLATGQAPAAPLAASGQ